MAKALKGTDEVLKSLGIEKKATIAFAMWQPWSPEDGDSYPQGFVGEYVGYKVAEKAIGDKQNLFDLFGFDACEPAPKGGETGFLVASGFKLEELKRVQPGTKIAIVYKGSEKNVHGGYTHNIDWFFATPADRNNRVVSQALPPSNADKVPLMLQGDN